jgi:hypothetical protein
MMKAGHCTPAIEMAFPPDLVSGDAYVLWREILRQFFGCTKLRRAANSSMTRSLETPRQIDANFAPDQLSNDEPDLLSLSPMSMSSACPIR